MPVLLDAGRTPSTLKLYVAAIADYYIPVDLIVKFLKGARRLKPIHLYTVPDLSMVRALRGPLFNPLLMVELIVPFRSRPPSCWLWHWSSE